MKCVHTSDKHLVNVVILSSPYLGSLAWLRERGLLFPSDLAREYEAIREPRGEYFVSLPEDLVDGR